MILCLIFSAASVSAAEINNTDQELSTSSNIDTLCANVEEDANNTNTLGVSEDTVLTAGVNDSGSDTILGDNGNEAYGTFDDLSKLISISNGKLNLYKNYKFSTEDSNKILTIDNLIINGNNHIIDYNNANNLNIIGKNVTLSNINFINQINPSFTNCIIINSTFDSIYNSLKINDGVKFINTTFTNNKNKVFYFSINTGYCDFWNCNFNNLISSFGFIYPQTATNCTINNCNFNNIRSNENSISHQLFSTTKSKNFVITNSTFINIKSKGAPIFGINDMYIYNCYFENIKSSNGFFNGKYLLMNNCTLKNIDKITADYINSTNNVYLSDSLTISSGSSHTFVNDTFSQGTTLTISVPYVKILDCNFINDIVKTNAPLIINSNYVTVNGCIFNNTKGTKNGAITVNNNAKVNLNNTYNTRSTLKDVTDNVVGFSLEDKLYVGPTATGTGSSIDDLCNLNYALEHIIDHGTIYFTNGTYEFGKSHTVSCNIIGYENDTVIIEKGSFSFSTVGLKIENIIFNNLQYTLNLGSYNSLINCTFKSTTLSNKFILISNMKDTISHISFEHVKTTYTYGLIGLISFNEYDDINFTQCTLSNIFKLADGGLNTLDAFYFQILLEIFILIILLLEH